MRKFRSFHLGKPERHFKWLYNVPATFFGLFYDRLASLYDLVTNAISMGLWRKWLAATQPFLPGPTILEIGHGPGHLQEMLAATGSCIFGLEPSSQMVQIAAHRLVSKGYLVCLTLGISQAIPFANEAFDQVVSTFPAEFITDKNTLNEIRRVLKPGGKLVILRFAWLSSKRWPYKATTWLFRLVGEAPAGGQPLPADELATPFQSAGFSVNIEQIDLGHSGLVIICCQLKE